MPDGTNPFQDLLTPQRDAPASTAAAPGNPFADLVAPPQRETTALDSPFADLATRGERMPGTLHLKTPATGLRPFAPGEWMDNPDGSWSSERSMTVLNPATNAFHVVPSLWLHNGQPVRARSEDEVHQFIKDSGYNFPPFASLTEAEQFANAREAHWQTTARDDASVAPLYQAGAGTLALPQPAVTQSPATTPTPVGGPTTGRYGDRPMRGVTQHNPIAPSGPMQWPTFTMPTLATPEDAAVTGPVPQVGPVTTHDLFGLPQAPPSQITNAPIGSTVTTPTLPSAKTIYDALFAPGTPKPSPITNRPVGSTITSPLDAFPYAVSQLKAGASELGQVGPGIGVQMAQRQVDLIDRIQRGEHVPPEEDLQGLAGMPPEQLAQMRAHAVDALQSGVQSMATGAAYQASLPADPALKQFQDAQGWRETAAALANAPGAVLQDTILRQLPALAAMTGASMLGGPAAGFVAGLAAMGPPAFGHDVISTMQQAGVDPNDTNARNAWVAANGDTIKSLFDQAMGRSAVQTGLMVGPFEAAKYLPFQGTVARTAAGAALGVGTGVAAPYVEEATGGAPATPQAVITSALPGAVMGGMGGVGGHVPDSGLTGRPVAPPPRVEAPVRPPEVPVPSVAPVTSPEPPVALQPALAPSAHPLATEPTLRVPAGPPDQPPPASVAQPAPVEQPVDPERARVAAAVQAEKDRQLAATVPRAPLPPEPPATEAPAAAPAAPEVPPTRAAAILSELNARNAPDEDYRGAFSTGSKDPLKPGETWRGRLEQWVASEAAATKAAEPAAPAPSETSAPGQANQANQAKGPETTAAPVVEPPKPAETSAPAPGVSPAAPPGEAARPTPTPAPASDTTATPTRRAVTPEELDALNKRAHATALAVAKAERTPSTPAETLDKLRQAAAEAQAARTNAEGPPSKPSYQRGQGPADAAAAHQAALDEHADRVAQRMHAEGSAPVVEPNQAGRAVRMGTVVQGKDTSGTTWTGTGHVMVRGTGLDRAVREAGKAKGAKPPGAPAPDAMDRVTQPQKGVTYAPLTLEHQVTPHGGVPHIVASLPNGQRIVIAKPIVDALMRAAGKDGTLMADARGPGVKASDTRVFAHDANGEVQGVGMPRRDTQRDAGIYATGKIPPPETKPAPAPRAKGKPKPSMADALPTLADDAQQRARAERQQPRETTTPEPDPELHDTTPTPDEQARADAAQTGLPPRFVDEMRTERPSLFNQAFREAGHDPAQAVNYPIAKQFRILADHLKTKFGFKDVAAHPADMRRAVDNLLDANRNLQTMAHVLGIRPEDISLGGRLSLINEPSGRTGYLGVYRARNRQIGITGRSNSFAHEWMHALDHFLVQHLARGGDIMDLASNHVMGQGFNAAANLNTDTAHAFSRVLNTLFTGRDDLTARMLDLHQTMGRYGNRPLPPEVLARRAELEQMIQAHPSEFLKGALRTGDPKYFSYPWEMLARAGEAYVSDRVTRLMDPSKTTEFITKTDRGYLSNADDRFRNTFPKDSERALIFDAYDQLFDALRRDQIIGDGTPGSARRTTLPGNEDIIDPRLWNISNVPPEQRGVAAALKRFAGGIADDGRTIARTVVEPAQLGGDALRRLGIDTSAGDGLAKQAWKTAGLALRTQVQAMGGRIGSVRAAYSGNARAQGLIQHLRNQFDPQPGKDIVKGPTYGQSVDREYKARMNQVINVLERHDLMGMTQTQKDQLRDQLTGHGTASTPAHIVQAAADLRPVLNDLWYYAHSKGLNVGYAAESYFPRVLVDSLVHRNHERFLEQAGKTYADQFDEIVNKTTNQTERTAEIARLIKQDNLAAVATDEAHARQAYGEANARDWLNRLIEGNQENFDTLGPDAGFTKQRVLPSSADVHMREFYVRDPVDALQQHVRQVVSRAEYVDRVGRPAKDSDGVVGSKMRVLVTEMRKAGVSAEHIAELKHVVELIAGRNRTGLTTPLQRSLDVIYALGTIGLMPRAMYASLAEPATVAMRTRDVEATVQAFKGLLTNVFKGDNAIRQQDIAHMFGIVSHSGFDSVMSERMTSGVHEGGRLAQFLTNFYQRFWLTGLTNYQRTAMVHPAEIYIRNLLHSSQTGKPGAAAEARAQLRELGMADHQHAAMHQWMQQQRQAGGLRAENMMNPEGRLMGNAIGTVIDQIIANPTRVDKPELAQNPMGRFMFGLMSFNYAIQHNLHGRIWNETARQGGFGSGLWHAAKFIPGIAALATANLAASLIRDQMFGVVNKNTSAEDEFNRSMFYRPASRMGLAGALDPLVQAWQGLKYQRGFDSLASGAQAGFFMSAVQKILEPYAGGNSADTNTAERNQTKGVHALMSVPIITAMTAWPGGGPLTALATLGTQWATSAAGADMAARLVAGEQQTRGGGGGRPSRPSRPERPSR